MSLINCPECTQQVSDQAALCPHCGHRLKRSTGSKIGLGLLGVFGAFVVLVVGINLLESPQQRAAREASARAECMEVLSQSMRSDVSRYSDCVAWAERAEQACRHTNVSGRAVSVAALCGPNLR